MFATTGANEAVEVLDELDEELVEEDDVEEDTVVVVVTEANFVKVDLEQRKFIYFNETIHNIPCPLISKLSFTEYTIKQVSAKTKTELQKFLNSISKEICYLNDFKLFNGVVESFFVENKLYIFFPHVCAIAKDQRKSIKAKQFLITVQYYFFKRRFTFAFFAKGTNIEKKYVTLPIPEVNWHLLNLKHNAKNYKIKYSEYDFPHVFIADKKAHVENIFKNISHLWRTRLMDDELHNLIETSDYLRIVKSVIIKSTYYSFNSNFFANDITVKPWITKPRFKTFDYFCCYDIETFINSNGILEAYMIACSIYDKNSEIIDKKCFFKIFDDTCFCDDVCLQFYKYIIDLFCNAEDENEGIYQLCLFGFNNFRFDDHIVLQQWFLKNQFNCQINKRGSLILMCQLKNAQLCITCKDLANWFPQQSLKSATKDFLSSEQRKMDFDILKFNQVLEEVNYEINDLPFLTEDNLLDFFPDLGTCYCDEAEELIKKYENKTVYYVCIDYCIQDVESTFQLYYSLNAAYNNLIIDLKNKFEHFNYNLAVSIFNYISPASFAGIISRCFLSLDKHQHIVFNNEEIAKKIFETYYGGRVCFGILGEYTSSKSLGYYDITSMYSLAMQANFPTVRCDNHIKTCECFLEHVKTGSNFDLPFFQKLIDSNNGEIINDYIFFCYADAILPSDLTKLISFGVLPERLNNGRINYPIKSYKDRMFNSVQLVTLRNFGYTIILKPSEYNIVFLKNEPIFNNLLKELVVFKSNAKINENKSLAKLIKLIGSSIYGKYAQKPVSKVARVNNFSKYSQNYEVEDYSTSTHYISAIITSYANYILTSVFKELEKPYIERGLSFEYRRGALLYCDTDSIVFDIAITNYNESYFPLDEELGSYDDKHGCFLPTWKRKYPTAQKIIVLGKKSYFILSSRYQILSKALKGIHTKEMNRFTYENITKVFQKADTFKFKGLKRNHVVLEGFSGNKKYSPFVEIEEAMIQKTLALTLDEDLELSHYTELDLTIFNTNDDFHKLLIKTLETNLPFFEKKIKKHLYYKKDIFHFLNFIKYY